MEDKGQIDMWAYTIYEEEIRIEEISWGKVS
jgi:hypothetical protein